LNSISKIGTPSYHHRRDCLLVSTTKLPYSPSLNCSSPLTPILLQPDHNQAVYVASNLFELLSKPTMHEINFLVHASPHLDRKPLLLQAVISMLYFRCQPLAPFGHCPRCTSTVGHFYYSISQPSLRRWIMHR